MFDSLSNRLNDVFDRLRGRGALGEDDVTAALREIRIALLEADVALPVVRDFVAAAGGLMSYSPDRADQWRRFRQPRFARRRVNVVIVALREEWRRIVRSRPSHS